MEAKKLREELRAGLRVLLTDEHQQVPAAISQGLLLEKDPIKFAAVRNFLRISLNTRAGKIWLEVMEQALLPSEAAVIGDGFKPRDLLMHDFMMFMIRLTIS